MFSVVHRILLRTGKVLSSPSLLNNSRIVYLPVGVSVGLFSTAMAQSGHKSICEFEVKDIDGEQVSLEKYRGFVTLIVNVASK